MKPICGLVLFPSGRGSRVLWRWVVLAATILFFLSGFSPSSIAQLKPEEYQVKAVYLYNFGRFIEWPANAVQEQQFDICLLGRDPFGAVLDSTLAGEVIGDRKLVARRIANSHDAAGCRILFISAFESARIKEILGSVEKSSILTVSDMPGFTSNGGMIQFVLKDNRVRFEVNLTATDRAGLSLSSQLLKVATEVRKEPSGQVVKP